MPTLEDALKRRIRRRLDRATPLADALREVDASLADAGDAAAEVVAELEAKRAGILYDIGDPGSLEDALETLSRAIRRLESAGKPREAALLLSEQAAVWIRIGDPVRARHLLTNARKVFASAAVDGEESARRELAEVDHLLARLPLHVASRPGYEIEAVRRAADHARRAEATYRALEDERELGRVWETLGRLEMADGRIDTALARLRDASQLQRRIGDVLGLARTADALAAALAGLQRYEAALRMVAESAELNTEKGSPRGLRYNRETLQMLMAVMPPDVQDDLADVADDVAARIEAGEASLEGD